MDSSSCEELCPFPFLTDDINLEDSCCLIVYHRLVPIIISLIFRIIAQKPSLSLGLGLELGDFE